MKEKKIGAGMMSVVDYLCSASLLTYACIDTVTIQDQYKMRTRYKPQSFRGLVIEANIANYQTVCRLQLKDQAHKIFINSPHCLWKSGS